ncbi:MAG: hypothetical protein IPH24_09675 [Crocinitomicaceae bacterium]|nr:hypothetical protein [Crocinitomicaceae bacterium]
MADIGDLLVVIEEEKHDICNATEKICTQKPTSVSLTQCLEIQLKYHFEGKAKIKIEPGTQSGKMLRLRGKGLPNLNGYGGDLFVHINVWTPKKVSSEEKAMLEKLGQSENFSPKPEGKEQGFFRKMKDFFQG